MKITFNKEKIENWGIGVLFIGTGIFVAAIMIAWLIYDIFIFSNV